MKFRRRARLAKQFRRMKRRALRAARKLSRIVAYVGALRWHLFNALQDFSRENRSSPVAFSPICTIAWRWCSVCFNNLSNLYASTSQYLQYITNVSYVILVCTYVYLYHEDVKLETKFFRGELVKVNIQHSITMSGFKIKMEQNNRLRYWL